MRYYYFFEPRPLRQIKAWKNAETPVDLANSGGHSPKFAGRKIFPVNFIMRHYITLSREHAIRKYSIERIYSEFEVKQRGWHGPRAFFDPSQLKFPDRDQLKCLEKGGWDRSEPWKHHTFFGRPPA
jgi:hypothetical protein